MTTVQDRYDEFQEIIDSLKEQNAKDLESKDKEVESLLEQLRQAQIKKITPFALDNGRLLRISEQLELQNDALLLTGDKKMSYKPLVVLDSASALGIKELGAVPVILTRQTIKHVLNSFVTDNQEEASLREVCETLFSLREELPSFILGYEDLTLNNTINLVIEKYRLQNKGLFFVVSLHIDPEHIEVTRLHSYFKKGKIKEIVEKAKSLDKRLFETDKTDNWLES